MGWIIALLFSALTWIALWRSGRCPRAALEIVAGFSIMWATRLRKIEL